MSRSMFIKEGGARAGDFPLSPFPFPFYWPKKGQPDDSVSDPRTPGPARTGKKNDFYAEQFILLYPVWGEGGEMWNRRFINTF